MRDAHAWMRDAHAWVHERREPCGSFLSDADEKSCSLIRNDFYLVFFRILWKFSTRMSTPNSSSDNKRNKETK